MSPYLNFSTLQILCSRTNTNTASEALTICLLYIQPHNNCHSHCLITPILLMWLYSCCFVVSEHAHQRCSLEQLQTGVPLFLRGWCRQLISRLSSSLNSMVCILNQIESEGVLGRKGMMGFRLTSWLAFFCLSVYIAKAQDSNQTLSLLLFLLWLQVHSNTASTFVR